MAGKKSNHPKKGKTNAAAIRELYGDGDQPGEPVKDSTKTASLGTSSEFSRAERDDAGKSRLEEGK